MRADRAGEGSSRLEQLDAWRRRLSGDLGRSETWTFASTERTSRVLSLGVVGFKSLQVTRSHRIGRDQDDGRYGLIRFASAGGGEV